MMVNYRRFDLIFFIRILVFMLIRQWYWFLIRISSQSSDSLFPTLEFLILSQWPNCRVRITVSLSRIWENWIWLRTILILLQGESCFKNVSIRWSWWTWRRSLESFFFVFSWRTRQWWSFGESSGQSFVSQESMFLSISRTKRVKRSSQS